ncbi:MAG TPA: hypothetical protein DCS79_03215, partial [Gammaproteobacteria bacterium]|nr:hypothetical protein [Gammaproteobacteria bacterium]
MGYEGSSSRLTALRWVCLYGILRARITLGDHAISASLESPFMSSSKLYPVTEQAAARSHLTRAQYEAMYAQSIENPEEFWAEQAGSLLHWHEPWRYVSGGNFATADSKWFEGARLNVAYNCID